MAATLRLGGWNAYLKLEGVERMTNGQIGRLDHFECFELLKCITFFHDFPHFKSLIENSLPPATQQASSGYDNTKIKRLLNRKNRTNSGIQNL